MRKHAIFANEYKFSGQKKNRIIRYCQIKE
nr:MAG TPA: hypothetical protein [Caudoviricetes sp.]